MYIQRRLVQKREKKNNLKNLKFTNYKALLYRYIIFSFFFMTIIEFGISYWIYIEGSVTEVMKEVVPILFPEEFNQNEESVISFHSFISLVVFPCSAQTINRWLNTNLLSSLTHYQFVVNRAVMKMLLILPLQALKVSYKGLEDPLWLDALNRIQWYYWMIKKRQNF